MGCGEIVCEAGANGSCIKFINKGGRCGGGEEYGGGERTTKVKKYLHALSFSPSKKDQSYVQRSYVWGEGFRNPRVETEVPMTECTYGSWR
jgi:hypothetical protein